jgi:DNA-binding LacI/PurR family transcriptional regulator
MMLDVGKRIGDSRLAVRTVRLADIAKAAGVSQGTASNVFSRPDIVREEVRNRVKAVAKQLGYTGPDPKGRLLRAGKVKAIGVVSVEPLAYFFEDPYARVLMQGISEECHANGEGISLVSAANEEELAWNMQSAVVDGFILFCLEGGQRLIDMANERRLPFVTLEFGTEDASISAISIDNVTGAEQAAQHLVDLGHRRFAVLSMPLVDDRSGPATWDQTKAAIYSASRKRAEGYSRTLSRAGIELETVPIFETENDEATTRAGMEYLFSLPEPPTAILAQSDRMALTAMAWLKERGLEVPEQVSIVGFDGVPEAAVSQPPLTTIVQPIADIGRRAVKAILDTPEEIKREVMQAKLVVRASTAPPTVASAKLAANTKT